MDRTGKIVTVLYSVAAGLIGNIAAGGEGAGSQLLAVVCLWSGGIITGLAIAHWDTAPRGSK